MNRTIRRAAAVTTVLLALFASDLQAGFEGGRYLDPDKSFSIRFSLGTLDGLSGSVEETKRAGAEGVTDEGRFLETYTFEELGFNDDYLTLGLELEKQWKYITLQLDVKYANLDASSTARRDYAIGVEEVSFQGQDYDYMLIPAGQKFDAEMDTLIADFKLKYTPFNWQSEERWISFSPWLIAGIYAAGGDFTIDAGPAQGLTTYEIDPFLYVIGGEGEGTAGALLPQFGGGGEIRFGLWEANGGRTELALQLDWSFLDLLADTGDLGINSRNEKSVDTDFENLELRAQFELPLSPDTDLLLGVGYEHIEADAEVEAKEKPPGQSSTEKYDKFVSLEMDTFYLFAGFSF